VNISLRNYGQFVYRHARLVLVLAGAALVVVAVLGVGAFSKLTGGGFQDPNAESTKAQKLVDDKFGGSTNLVLLVHAKSGDADTPAVRAAGTRLAAALTAEPDVHNVASYWTTGAPALRSTDGRDALIAAHVAGDNKKLDDRTAALIGRYTGTAYSAGGAVSVKAGGDAAASHDVPGEVTKSLAVAEAIAVPLTLLLLVLVFGGLVAASLPLIIGMIAIFGTFAELFVLGSLTNVSVFAINITTALGLALGVDYALLLVSRFREQLTAGDSVEDAVVTTVRTAGRTILFGAATVAIALSALLVFPLYFLRSFAYAGIGVVIVAAVAALVVIPALLSVLGTRVNRGRLPWAGRWTPESAFWGRLASTVMRRPALTALPVALVLLILALPLLGVSFGTPDSGVLPKHSPSRQVSDTLESRFAGNASAGVDIVTTGPVDAAALTAYADRISHLPGVAKVDTLSHQPGPQRLSVLTTLEPKSGKAQDLVRQIRATPDPGGVETLVGGVDAELIDTKHSIGGRLPLAGLMVVLTTFVILFLFTGSVVQPLRALLLNGLSLASTLGAMTWIFQGGHLSSLLGFTPRPMDTAMTVLLFCITFGLSMDYEVIVTSRIKELHDEGKSPAAAVTVGLSRTGRIVSTAAALMAVSFLAFGTGTVSFLQMFGLGSGLAILLDATLVRGVLVPATLRLLGRAAWYAPGPLRRVSARVRLSET
jgi:putative drug exporter of the RND superfamily